MTEDWEDYEIRKRALPPLSPEEYDLAIAAILEELGL